MAATYAKMNKMLKSIGLQEESCLIIDFNFHKQSEDMRKSFSDQLEYLKDNGYSLIGKGLFASVFTKPYSRKVIKIGASYEIDGYRLYAPWCMKEVEKLPEDIKPFFPKIYSHTEYGNVFYVTEIERLKSLNRKIKKYSDRRDLIFNLKMDACLDTKELQALRKAYMHVYDNFASKVRIDVHDENIMLRKEQFVITDPIAHINSY